MSAKPLPQDQFVCRWRDRLALAVKDDAAAAQFARFMHSIAGKIDVRLVTSNGSQPARQLSNLDSSEPRTAPTNSTKPIKIASKYAGRCRSCGAQHEEGDAVCWSKGVKGVQCLRCGGAR